MDTYSQEQALTDKYGTTIMNQVAASFYDKFNIERVTEKETQIKGVDYYFWKYVEGRSIKIPVDIKIDFYENDSLVYELYQQYEGVGRESWVNHDPNIWICYFKVYQRKAYLIQIKDLIGFSETELFKKRKAFNTVRKVNGNSGGFKMFRFSELPIHHIVNISLMIDPFTTDDLLITKSSLPDYKIYENREIEK